MSTRMIRVALIVMLALGASAGPGSGSAVAATPISVYGAWHCSDDACTWAKVRSVTEFDSKNHWLIDRGDGHPSVNLVILSFVNPLRLLTASTEQAGTPIGMTSDIVDYFTSHGIRVMVSIGGITYTKDWTTALGQNATLLGQRAAALASRLGVGVEIDYEESSSPDLAGLQAFITAYRGAHPYDPSGADPTARLTIDLAAGDRWLIGIAQKATADWLKPGGTVLDYANAMVPSKQPSASSATANWQEHIDGKPRYNPPIPALAPARLTGSLYLAEGSKVRPECNNYSASLQKATAGYVASVAPNGAGTTAGMLGFMFWAAERPSTRGVTTQPPNGCELGMGAGATALGVQIPMPALRQQ